MAEYTGSAIAASIFGISLAGLRSIRIEESANIPQLDATHSGDATKQMVDDIPDAPAVTATFSGVLQAGSANNLPAGSVFAVGTSGSWYAYPEGTGSLKPIKSCNSAYVQRRSVDPAIGAVTTYEIVMVNTASGSLSHSGVA
jgi:hypothetical protein